MADDIEAFIEARSLLLESGLIAKDLICKVGGDETPTLKLLKTSWTNDAHDQIGNTSGVFFSIWESTLRADRGRLLYNIHALKLRNLKGYKLEGKKFAAAFRNRFTPHLGSWPNVSTNFGPLTLMQGWIGRRPDHLAQDVYSLAAQFREVVPIIDRLLGEATHGSAPVNPEA